MARVLIADDDRRAWRDLASLFYGRYQVVSVSGGAALEVMPLFRPDMVLLDLKAAGIDWRATLRNLLLTRPRAEVLVMTDHGSVAGAVEAMRCGASSYITKPVDRASLLFEIDSVLQARSAVSEAEAVSADLQERFGFVELVGVSPQLQEIFKLMAKVARVEATVLITGESGTGKELVARAIHRKSRRAPNPFVAVNCSAIPSTLIESELFGHERGAFTDARDRRAGRFGQAHTGTLFLDEVGDLALEAQPKILRTLQHGEIFPVGSQRPTTVNIRVIAATNRNLERLVTEGTFREDLYWRLSVINIDLPPLRRRRGDLPLLVDHLFDRFRRELAGEIHAIAPEARDLLIAYDWPGNIRELENVLLHAMVVCERQVVTPADLPPRLLGGRHEQVLPAKVPADSLAMVDAVHRMTERYERTLIASRLAAHQGNRTDTARSLGVSRKTLFNKMRRYGFIYDRQTGN
jgi:DNA-binding NtrC family response regulator